jgi:hypothetical protein
MAILLVDRCAVDDRTGLQRSPQSTFSHLWHLVSSSPHRGRRKLQTPGDGGSSRDVRFTFMKRGGTTEMRERECWHATLLAREYPLSQRGPSLRLESSALFRVRAWGSASQPSLDAYDNPYRRASAVGCPAASTVIACSHHADVCRSAMAAAESVSLQGNWLSTENIVEGNQRVVSTRARSGVAVSSLLLSSC